RPANDWPRRADRAPGPCWGGDIAPRTLIDQLSRRALFVAQQLLRLAAQVADLDGLVPADPRTPLTAGGLPVNLLDPLASLFQAIPRLVGISELMVGHGKEEPVPRAAGKDLRGYFQLVDRVLIPAGAVKRGAEHARVAGRGLNPQLAQSDQPRVF